MKKLLGLGALASMMLLTGCATYQPAGAIFNNATMGVAANNNVKVTKTGKACATSVLALVATGDASVKAAMKEGNITNIATVDTESHNILGIYGKYCTIVRGN
tara:strand:- start:14072 stop:14380 length:309 start_codon:yes stop_codon:yes gene_type:complete